MSRRTSVPDLSHERRLWAIGYRCVAGLDEAGRGAWAGPVVAAAVILPPEEPRLLHLLAGVRDSKELSPARRELLVDTIQEQAVALGVGAAPPHMIDALGIVAATRVAMALALESLSLHPDHLLIDHLALPEVALPQIAVPKGDAHILSVAAASIVAKVARDRTMVALEKRFPGYGFAQHKGYGTAQHRAALESLGPSSEHRLSFAPLRALRNVG